MGWTPPDGIGVPRQVLLNTGKRRRPWLRLDPKSTTFAHRDRPEKFAG